MQLSKSEYMMFLKHPAWLWFKKHDKSKLPEVDANLQAVFDAGTEFEKYAEQRFPEGHKLGFDGYQQYLSLPERTLAALAAGKTTIFQGRLEADDITSVFDILVKTDEDTFDLYEIKSSTRAKPEHEHDLAFQMVVLKEAGFKIGKLAVIHVNGKYVRKGEIDPLKLTAETEITDKVKQLEDETRRLIEEAKKVAAMPKPPDFSPRHAGKMGFGDWLAIYKSLIGGFDDESIYNLCSADAEIIGQLEDAGITTIKDIPPTIKLNPRQKRQVEAVQRGSSQADKDKINDFLAGLEYPLYFLDYETLSDAVPPFDGLKPYDQLPFQYSLHVIKTPGDKLEHYEYLHTEPTDPTPELVERLRNDIGDTGSVLVWWEGFEKKCNQLMGELYPEGKELLEAVNRRIVDLMLPFANGWYTDAGFFGSASIKNVLPVMVPELSYQDLEISEGGSAQRLWMDKVLRGKPVPEGEALFDNLRQYCKLDTLAMVEIYKRLLDDSGPTATGEERQLSIF